MGLKLEANSRKAWVTEDDWARVSEIVSAVAALHLKFIQQHCVTVVLHYRFICSEADRLSIMAQLCTARVKKKKNFRQTFFH